MEEKDKLQELLDSAKDMAEKAAEQLEKAKDKAAVKFSQFSDVAGEKLDHLKEAAGEKLAEWSDKAEKMAAEAREEAAAKAAEVKAAKEKIAAHEGGALGFLTDKANELLGEMKTGAADAMEKGKNFWEKAQEYGTPKTGESSASGTREDESADSGNSDAAD